MRKIIDRKVYDTETAEHISDTRSPGYGPNDFNYWTEDLYRTPSGNWFLWGRGNASSKYAQSVGQNSWGAGSEVRIMTEDEVIDWLEEHDQKKLEELFPDAIEEA